MLIEDVTYGVLGRDIRESRILDIDHIDELIDRIHRRTRQTQTYGVTSVVSVMVMRTNEESKCTSITSFSMQTLTVKRLNAYEIVFVVVRSILQIYHRCS